MIVKGIDYIENNHELAMNLKIARENTSLTQQNVGDLINLERSTLAYYEIGKSIPPIFTLVHLSKAYNLEPIALITRKYRILY